MDYEAVRQGLEQAIPFNRHVGLDVAEVGDGRGVVRLPDDERLHNHVGSQHAGALFSAGEAASGAAFVGAFAERMGEITPSASAEPDMAENTTLCRTLTWAMPPRKRPTSTRQNCSRRSVRLPIFIRSAARMNSGIASST